MIARSQDSAERLRARSRHCARTSSVATGFTLIEILVSIVISALLVLGARALLDAMTDAAARTHARAISARQVAVGERLLREIVGQIEVGTRQERGFGGDARAAEFWSWCDVPDGWQERCDVRLAIASRDSTQLLTMQTSISGAQTQPALVLRRLEAPSELRYLNSASGGGDWFSAWGKGITAPLAIAIVSARDTTIIAIGERG